MRTFSEEYSFRTMMDSLYQLKYRGRTLLHLDQLAAFTEKLRSIQIAPTDVNLEYVSSEGSYLYISMKRVGQY